MRLVTKTILILITSISVFTIVTMIILYFILIREFSRIEDERLATNITRTINSLNEEYEKIGTKLNDWATWDDTYRFVQKPNQAYLNSNLSNDALSLLDIDFVVIASKSGGIVHFQFQQPKDSNNTQYSSDSIRGLFLSRPDILIQNNPKGVKQGFVAVDDEIVMISAKPILDSSGQSPIGGVILFGAYLTSGRLSELSKLTQNTIDVVPVSHILSELSEGSSSLDNHQDYFKKINSSESITGYTDLKDLDGNSIAMAGVNTNRDIFLQARRVILTIIGLIILMGFIMGVTAYVVLNRWILIKLKKLSDFMKGTDLKNITKRKIEIKGSDEISDLAQNVNEMLERINDYETKEKDTQKILQSQIKEIESQNIELIKAKNATLRLLDKQKIIEEELKKQKAQVEDKVKERTKDLEEKTLALKNAQNEISSGWLQLQEEKARLTASINSLPKGFIITDLNKNVITANIHVDSILGRLNGLWTIGEIQKRIGPSINFEEILEKSFSSNKVQKVGEIQFGEKFLRVLVLPIIQDYSKKSIGAVILIEDVTEEKVLARSRDEFFSIASHELRTPLTSIRGNTSLIQQYYSKLLKDKNLKEMIDDIYDSSTRLIQIVNDFLDVSRIEQGRLEYKIEKVDILKLVEEVVQELKTNASEKGLDLSIENKATQKNAQIDRDRSKQIIFNLIGNAIKYTEAGSVKIVIESTKTKINVKILDTGRGIPVESRSLLFRKFQQASNNLFTRDTTKGTGLGLYISKILARGMKGDVDLLESEEGKGSTFVFSAPIEGR